MNESCWLRLVVRCPQRGLMPAEFCVVSFCWGACCLLYDVRLGLLGGQVVSVNRFSPCGRWFVLESSTAGFLLMLQLAPPFQNPFVLASLDMYRSLR